MIPELCQQHRRDLVVRLDIPETGPWLATMVTGQILLFQTAARSDVIWQRCSKVAGTDQRDANDLSLVLAEIGCLACYRPDWFDMVIRLIDTEGLHFAAQVAQAKKSHPDFPWPSSDS